MAWKSSGCGFSSLNWYGLNQGLRLFSIRNRSCLLFALLLLSAGCQSLQPFAQRTREKIAAARQYANGGLEAFQCGQLQRARGFFQQATEQRPDDFRSRANLARTMDQSGELSGAIVQMQQAVEQSGNDPRMLVELGEMYLRAGQYLPAMRQAENALKEDYHLASAWHLKGKVHRARSEWKSALEEFQRAAGLSPGDAQLPLDIAITYRKLGQPLKALASIENLLAQFPVDSQPESALLMKSELLLDQKQHATAIAMLRRATRAQPESAQLVAQLAQAQSQAGQWSDARATLVRGQKQFGRRPIFDQVIKQLPSASSDAGRFVVNAP